MLKLPEKVVQFEVLNPSEPVPSSILDQRLYEIINHYYGVLMILCDSVIFSKAGIYEDEFTGKVSKIRDEYAARYNHMIDSAYAGDKKACIETYLAVLNQTRNKMYEMLKEIEIRMVSKNGGSEENPDSESERQAKDEL